MLLRDGLTSEVFSIGILSIAHLITRATYAHAQTATTTAVCGQGFDWMSNAQGQSPCLVASILQAACGTGTWTVPALPRTASGQQQAYLAPNATNANVCTCSAAVYNLMSACAACQDGRWLLFSPWGLLCGNEGFLTVPNSFPSNIAVSGGTTIPKYATTDPRTWSNGRFSVTEAQAIALGDPVPSFVSFSSGFVSSATSVHDTPSSTIFSAAPTNFNSNSSSNDSNTSSSSISKKSDDTGAIVGGVVGGFLGIALITVLLIWLLCGERIRHRQQRYASKGANGIITAEKTNILERAFTTPSAPLPPLRPSTHPAVTPPPLANIVVPIAVRPHPVTRDFPSYSSGGSTSVITGSADESNYNQTQPFSHVQNPSVPSGASVPITTSASAPTSGSTEGGGSANRTLIHRLITSVGWRSHTLSNSNGSIGSGTIMTPTDLLSSSTSANAGVGANGTPSGGVRGSGSRSRRGTRSGSYSGGGGGIVLGEQDRPVLQNMSQHEANQIMATPVPFIIPSRPSSQAYDGMDYANGRNHDMHGQLNTNQNQNGHANGVYQANGGRKANRGSYGLSAAEEKRRLQKSMGRGVSANVTPPRYTQNALFSTPDQEPGNEFTHLRRQPSLDNGSLSATLGSQSQLHLPSEEEVRYEHHEHLSPSYTNFSSPPNAPYPPNSTNPPHSPVSPHSPNSFTRQSSFVDPSPLAIRSPDASSGVVDTSPIMMTSMNTNSTRSRPTSALRFTVANPSHGVEM